MLNLRTFARTVSKAPLLRTSSNAARSLSSLARPSALRLQPSTSRILRLHQQATFTSSVKLKEEATKAGSSTPDPYIPRMRNEELAAMLGHELQLEQETTASSDLPAELQEFLTSSGFEVKDVNGDEEVVLTKNFGNETIKVTFTVADLATEHDPDAFLQDRALQDEAFDDLEGDMNKKAINAGRPDEFATAPEDNLDPNAAADPSTVPDDAGFPVTMNVTVTKQGTSSALQFSVAAHDGTVGIERFNLFRDSAQADAQTADVQWGARNSYTGPPFGNLDEGLQEVLERYLEERGIDTQLALWVPEYIEFKEQQEYMKWLEATKAFVET